MEAEFYDTPIGGAFLEWNSKSGVPIDVWATICTAVIHCNTCDLIRTFNADRAHRNFKGECLDVGQKSSRWAIAGKGKDVDGSYDEEDEN